MANRVPRLAEQREATTLRVILVAAREAFAEHGYARTSVRQIAQAAGVAHQTIYAHFGSKAGVLMGLVDLLDEEAGLAELFDPQPHSQDPAEILGVLALASRQVHERCGDIVDVLRSGAAVDSAIAATQAEGIRRNRLGVDVALERVRAVGGHPVSHAGDIAAALMTTGLVESLVKEAGWSYDAYESWLRQTLVHSVLGHRDCLPTSADAAVNRGFDQ